MPKKSENWNKCSKKLDLLIFREKAVTTIGYTLYMQGKSLSREKTERMLNVTKNQEVKNAIEEVRRKEDEKT